MITLKQLPLAFKGILHDIRLVCFSVDPNEVTPHLPYPFKPKLINGRAMISMVDVQLKEMHLKNMPSYPNFTYRHLGFRLLLDDSHLNQDQKTHGIFFIKSFTDSPLFASGGNLIGDFNLEVAIVKDDGKTMLIDSGSKYVKYSYTEDRVLPDESIYPEVARLDKAYSRMGDKLRVLQISRDQWPIEQVKCTGFETNHFKTAKLEAMYRVFEPIDYIWTRPQLIPLN